MTITLTELPSAQLAQSVQLLSNAWRDPSPALLLKAELCKSSVPELILAGSWGNKFPARRVRRGFSAWQVYM